MKKTIYFAGGCFWGVQAYFFRVNGVIDTKVGYANGIIEEATYQNLKNTLHAETVKITYEDSLVSIGELVLHLFKIIEPDSLNKQGGDIGIQYRTGVYYENEDDFIVVNKLFELLKNNYKEFYVELLPLKHFILGEEYHQDYLVKNPNGYCHVNLNVDYKLNSDELKLIESLR
ncbi:peptide-methionine (S)-S-oxide reductase MsrA [Mycoplasmopsis arginini]|uniref:peptide-methionine (S)-S-oxide reductase MsrA n=1 Tax=Mycoplasmopsis arginini TaxID=2094 RepID=UPI003512261D